MLEKAQNLKRKVNLEEPAGKKSYALAVLSKPETIKVASTTGLNIGSNRLEAEVVEKVHTLDVERVTNFSISYNSHSCRDPESNLEE
jgi:hypothetical protein